MASDAGFEAHPARRQRRAAAWRHGNTRAWRSALLSLPLLALTLAAAAERVVLPNGDVYEGDVVGGVWTGRGAYTGNQHRYVGEFLNGKMHGDGVFHWPDGRVYEGAFVNEKRHGRGKLTWPDGRVFEGNFVNDQREGRGVLAWPNGNVYAGDFRADQITGAGRLTWKNLDVYEGDFVNGQRSGWGAQTWSNGNRYVGEWRANRREGIGAYHWKDGTVYYGQFVANSMHGHGVKHPPDDDERRFQRWRAGQLVADTLIDEDERCRLALDGHAWMFESGECVNGRAHGRGVAVRLDGEAFIADGRFVLGALVQGEVSWLTVPGH